MMYMFGLFMGIILVAEIAVVITIAVFKDDAVAAITDGLQKALDNYDPANPKYQGVTETWNVLQHDLQCCGVKDSSDWKNTPFGKDGDLPDSCCKFESDGCGKDSGSKQGDFYSQGCLTIFIQLVEDNSLAALGG